MRRHDKERVDVASQQYPERAMRSLIVTETRLVRRTITTRDSRVRRPIGLLFVLVSLFVIVGCSKDNPSTTVAGGAQISADPNPVPAGSEKFGKTTIIWDTGDGSIGEVYVSVNGAPDKLFAGNRAKSSKEAAWIGKGQHEFKLYAGKAHEKLLASVTVTRLRN
jgi:hypothetical protein